jgi:PAS domain S-box-containing protein
MEQYLRQHEDQYRTLVEDLNVGIYRSTGDPRGRFVWGNTALLNILGYHSISDLREVPVADVFDEPDGRRELLEELQTSQFVKNRVIHLKKPDGTPFSVNVTALAEFDEDRNVVFINGIVQDISHIIVQNTTHA